jgi:hypothetical protein
MENGLKTQRIWRQGFVKTGDDTTHSITQIGKVPLSMWDGQTKYLKDVLHVPVGNNLETSKKWKL